MYDYTYVFCVFPGDGDIDYEEFCGIMRDVVSMVTERERQMKDAFTVSYFLWVGF